MTQVKYKLMAQVKLMNICCPNIVLKQLYCFKTIFFFNKGRAEKRKTV